VIFEHECVILSDHYRRLSQYTSQTSLRV